MSLALVADEEVDGAKRPLRTDMSSRDGSISSKPRDDRPVIGAYFAVSMRDVILKLCEYTYLRHKVVGKEVGIVDESGWPHLTALLFHGNVAGFERGRHNVWFLGFHPGSASFAVLWNDQQGGLEADGKERRRTVSPCLLLLPLNSFNGLVSPHKSHVISVRWLEVCSLQVIPELAASMR